MPKPLEKNHMSRCEPHIAASNVEYGRRTAGRAKGGATPRDPQASDLASVLAVVLAIAVLSVWTAAIAGPTAASFVLIDASTNGNQPLLSGCASLMSDLHERLDQAGTENVLMRNPTTEGFRAGLLKLGAPATGPGRVFVFCGYATADEGPLFVLSSDAAATRDPGRNAVSAAAFSRLPGASDGAVLLDLHVSTVGGSAASSIPGAVATWAHASDLQGRRVAIVTSDPAQAPLLAAVTHIANFSADAVFAAASAAAGAASSASNTTHSTVEAVSPALPSAQAKPLLAHVTPPPAPAPESVLTAALPPAPATAPTVGTQTPELSPPPASKPVPTPAHEKSVPHRGTKPAIPSTNTSRKPVLHLSAAVRAIQVALLAHGMFEGRVTGIDDVNTHRAVRHFQAALGHPATGVLTSAEIRALTGG